MSTREILLLAIRWLHLLAALAWVGGSLFYFFILSPSLKRHASEELSREVGREFRSLVFLAILVLIVTGTVLAVDRLTTRAVGAAYISVLGVKIAIALYMFYLVRFLRSRSYPEEGPTGGQGARRLLGMLSGTTAILVLGVIVFLLSDVLQALFERGLAGR